MRARLFVANHRLLLVACICFSFCLTGCVRHVVPARRFAAPCPTGQVRICTGQCAPASGAGGACTPGLDECASGFQPCQENLSCARTSPGASTGVCEAPPSLFCDPSIEPGNAGNICPPESFCIPWGSAEQVRTSQACMLRPRLSLTPPPTGVCARAQLDGESCDSEWASATRPHGPPASCKACAPGLMCWNGFCRRPCRDGLGDCPPPERTGSFSTAWACTTQTGRRRQLPTDFANTQPLCTDCVPHLQACDLPATLQQQSPSASSPCCAPGDACARPFDLTGSMTGLQKTCCKPPAFGNTPGGECSSDQDCCPIFVPVLGNVARCCRPGDRGNGCGPAGAGRCAGCGPGTGIPCCTRDAGCGANQTCVGEGDRASCISCGTQGLSCCQTSGQPTCNNGLTCSPDQNTPTGDRCEICGAAGQQCCPGRACNGSQFACEGPGAGTCVQTCGQSGQSCCTFTNPPAPLCNEGLGCNDNGTCGACGGQGQVCCEGALRCNAGLSCSNALRCRPIPCGGNSEQCCRVGPACQEGLRCSAGLCGIPP